MAKTEDTKQTITRDHIYPSGRIKRTIYELTSSGFEIPIHSEILKGVRK